MRRGAGKYYIIRPIYKKLKSLSMELYRCLSAYHSHTKRFSVISNNVDTMIWYGTEEKNVYELLITDSKL